MNIIPEIKHIDAKLLVGMSKKMSLTQNKTVELFSSFMPKKKVIKNLKNSFVLDLIVYPKDYYKAFNPEKEFEKWAVAEVTSYDEIPEEMNTFDLSEGLYAVFYQENTENTSQIFEYIFREWLPKSNYILNDKPHFDVLNPANKKEQKVYIPIKKR